MKERERGSERPQKKSKETTGKPLVDRQLNEIEASRISKGKFSIPYQVGSKDKSGFDRAHLVRISTANRSSSEFKAGTEKLSTDSQR